MARPNKTGLDYYNTETNRYSDPKIRKLVHTFSTSGIAVYDYIVSTIYRDKGCFTVWDESTVFDVADYLKMKETTVNEIISYCGVVGLFDKELLTNGKYITSRSIQERYVAICIQIKRKKINVPELIRLIPEETIVNTGGNEVNTGESTQRKGKERKGNNIPPKEGFGNSNSFHGPSEILVQNWPERYLVIAKGYAVDDVAIELSKFDSWHKQTSFTDTKHLLNAWNLWCSKTLQKKQNYETKTSELTEKPRFKPAKKQYF